MTRVHIYGASGQAVERIALTNGFSIKLAVIACGSLPGSLSRKRNRYRRSGARCRRSLTGALQVYGRGRLGAAEPGSAALTGRVPT